MLVQSSRCQSGIHQQFSVQICALLYFYPHPKPMFDAKLKYLFVREVVPGPKFSSNIVPCSNFMLHFYVNAVHYNNRSKISNQKKKHLFQTLHWRVLCSWTALSRPLSYLCFLGFHINSCSMNTTNPNGSFTDRRCHSLTYNSTLKSVSADFRGVDGENERQWKP
jgi:hypothetical protein